MHRRTTIVWTIFVRDADVQNFLDDSGGGHLGGTNQGIAMIVVKVKENRHGRVAC